MIGYKKIIISIYNVLRIIQYVETKPIKLTCDCLFFPQLQVEAEKQFTVNLQKATSNVTITVTRNPNGPVFNETDSIYEVTIDETRELGSTILQLYAPDADRVGLFIWTYLYGSYLKDSYPSVKSILL